MSDTDARQQAEGDHDEGAALSETTGLLPGDDDAQQQDANEYETTELDD